MIVNIIYLLYGYKIIYFQEHRGKTNKKAKICLLALIEISTTIIFLYIVDFIPSLDNFYLFFARYLIESLVIYVIWIKMLLDNFINLYRQYRLERRIRAILTLAYKYKLIIYSKVFIFSFLYSLGFIAMNILQIINHINEYYDGLVYVYYMDVALELFFTILFCIIFFPQNYSLFYFLDLNANINFIAEIKTNKEKNLQVNNLRKKRLKEKYLKKEYPLILLEPFTKIDTLLTDCHIHIGITKNK